MLLKKAQSISTERFCCWLWKSKRFIPIHFYYSLWKSRKRQMSVLDVQTDFIYFVHYTKFVSNLLWLYRLHTSPTNDLCNFLTFSEMIFPSCFSVQNFLPWLLMKLAKYRSSSRTDTLMWYGLTQRPGWRHSWLFSSLSPSVLSRGIALNRITITRSSRHT